MIDDDEAAARASLRRSALIYAAMLAGVLALIGYLFSLGVSGGGYVMVVLIAVVSLALAFQTLQHLRDLAAAPVKTEGPIARKWSRADLIIAWESFYIGVERRIFKLEKEQYIRVEENMRVIVTHFPHTLSVISVRDAARPDPSGTVLPPGVD